MNNINTALKIFNLTSIPEDEQKLKNLYKDHAFKLHPDRNNGETTEQFQNLNNAYETLLSSMGNDENDAQFISVDLNDIFNSIFGFPTSQPRVPIKEITENVEFTFIEFLENTPKILNYWGKKIKIFPDNINNCENLRMGSEIVVVNKQIIDLPNRISLIGNDIHYNLNISLSTYLFKNYLKFKLYGIDIVIERKLPAARHILTVERHQVLLGTRNLTVILNVVLDPKQYNEIDVKEIITTKLV